MINPTLPLQCPAPTGVGSETITLAHGEGGRLLRRLLQEQIFPALRSQFLRGEDAVILPQAHGNLAFTTDSFVVSPLFFPGGDIGTLAVFGTVNDLAVSGARPLWISLALIIEEGLPTVTLDQILQSVAAAAQRAAVTVVTGDTKVVPRGTVDKLFINTAGIGELVLPTMSGPASLAPGDRLIVSGPIGRHGVAVMAAREQFDFRPEPTSDCAPLTPAVAALRTAGVPIKAMRDATRGGVAAVLHEWAVACGQTMAIEERSLPLTTDVRGVCELLGLDPLHVANEGTMVVAVAPEHAQAAITILQTIEVSAGATQIGFVQTRGVAPVLIQRGLGRYQPLDEPLGAPLPRIC
jgi:hydrogenase expression/formation protein HypE